jgi:hypothetical protein
MAKLTQEVTTTQTTVVELSPKLRQALMTKLTAYRQLTEQKKAIVAKLETLTAELDAIRDEAEEMSVSLEGYGTVTLVAGTYSKFNPKKFIALGGNLAIYEEAVEVKPRKAYAKVTIAGTESAYTKVALAGGQDDE